MSGRHSPGQVEACARHLEECRRCAALLYELNADDPLAEALRGQGVMSSDFEDEPMRALIDRLASQLPSSSQFDDSTRAESSLAFGQAGASAEDTLWNVDDLLAPPTKPGEVGQLGPYRILRRLGAGGMGVVYLAQQDRPSRLVAVKMVLAGPRAGSERRARFLGETEIIARLQHANIVPVYEVGEHDGQPYYTMEYVAGGSLARRLAASPLAPREAGELVKQLAGAVSFAHQHGVVHRDLKPGNILLQSNDLPGQRQEEETGRQGGAATAQVSLSGHTPKISDFGVAKQLDVDRGQTQTGAILGTPGYMAPEQAQGSKQIGPLADVYSLGAILYECLTGRPPFRAATVLETLEQVRTQEPVAPSRLQPGVPRDLQTITLKCLEKAPKRRYLSAEALADDLGRFLRGEPIHARAVGFIERLGKWVRRKPALAALAGVSAVLFCALIFGVFIHYSRLNTALLKSEASAEEARTQRQRAETNYRQAREAINRMLARLNDSDGAAKMPGAKLLEQKQREDALAFFQEVVREIHDPEPALQFDVATAYLSAAGLKGKLGLMDMGEQELHQARVLLEELTTRYPSDIDYRMYLAKCYLALGILYGVTNEFAQCGHYRQLTVDVCKQLCQAEPNKEQWQNYYIAANINLGGLYFALNEFDQAKQCYEEARAGQERLAAKHPEAPTHRAGIAIALVNLGEVYWATGDAGHAELTFQEASALLEPILRGSPLDPDFVTIFNGLATSRAHLLITQDKPRQAMDLLTRGMAPVETLWRQEPESRKYGNSLVESYLLLGRAHLLLGQESAAAQDWKRLLELSNKLAPEEADPEHALALAEMGRWQEAAGLAIASGVPFKLYRFALALAACSTAAGKDAKLSAELRTRKSDEYAGQALALLRKVHEAGYFKSAIRATDLRQDPVLAALRTRPEFQDLFDKQE
jgi:serine/threonine-protein kinase